MAHVNIQTIKHGYHVLPKKKKKKLSLLTASLG